MECPLPPERCRDSWHVDCCMEFYLFGCAFDDANIEQLQAGLLKLKECERERGLSDMAEDMMLALEHRLQGVN